MTEAIGKLIAYIQDYFSNMGIICTKMLNGALNLFYLMVLKSQEQLTASFDPAWEYNSYGATGRSMSTYGDLWEIISTLNKTIGVIATTLIVLFFIYSLCSEAWDSRHEFEIFAFLKSFARFLVAILLVNNSNLIVYTIFNLAGKVAGVIAVDTSDYTLALSDKDSLQMQAGISGGQGLLFTIVILIVMLVIVSSGITIMLEVYERIFKIFVLIPFSCVSFAAFTITDNNRGSEIFHGYLKSVLATAIESIIIMLIIAFSVKLIKGDTMEKMFPSNGMTTKSYSVENAQDVVYMQYCYQYHKYTSDTVDMAVTVYSDDLIDASSGLSAKAVMNARAGTLTFGWNLIKSMFTSDDSDEYEKYYNRLPTFEKLGKPDFISSKLKTSLDNHNVSTPFDDTEVSLMILNVDVTNTNTKVYDINSTYSNDPYTYTYTDNSQIICFGPVEWKDILVIILRCLFPILLCASGVKMVGQISGMILGR